MIINIRLSKDEEDKLFFKKLEYESFKTTLKDIDKLTEDEIRKKYKEFDENDPIDLYDSTHYIYIAEDESGKRIGLIWICNREPFWRYETQLLWIYNLHIIPEYRGNGIAFKLMQAAEIKAKELGLSLISLHVIDNNLPARNLYEKMGYRLAATHNESCFYDKRLD